MRPHLQLSLVLCSVCFSPVIAEETVADGAITGVSEQIGKLIQLKWVENRLVIDREHWNAKNGNMTEGRKKASELEAMIKRGIPLEIAKRMVDRDGDRRRRGFRETSPEGHLFEELKIAANARSGGGGGNNNERQWRGRGDGVQLSMYRNKPNQILQFMIREGATPFQEFVIEDHGTKGLRIQFSSPNRILLFSQSPQGRIRVAHVSDQINEAFQSPSYDAMAVSHPKFTADLEHILGKIGITRPYSLYDPRILETVGRLLHRPDSGTVEAAEAVIAKLAHSSYAVREAAQKQADDSAIAWRGVFEGKLADPNLSSEVRHRLQRALVSNGVRSTTAERFVRQRKLLDDVEYLSTILDQIPESLRPSVRLRIAELRSSEEP